MKVTLLSSLLLAPLLVFGQQQEKRTLEPFNRVDVMGAGNIFLVEGDEPSLEIKMKRKRDDVQEIESKIIGGQLIIGPRKYNYSKGRMDLIITYQAPLQEVSFEGSGKIYFDKVLKTDDFVLKALGAETIYLEIEANSLTVDLSGAGVIHLTGQVNEQHLNIDGAGKIWALELISQKTWVELSGAGKIELTAEQELYADLSGVGKIEYAGDPLIRQVDNTGLGKVKPY